MTVLWFESEASPIGSRVNSWSSADGDTLVRLWELGGEALLEEVVTESSLRCYGSAPHPIISLSPMY